MNPKEKAAWLVLGLMLACAYDPRAEYAIVHLNTGNETVDDVTVKFGEFESLCGVLIPNGEKIHDGVKTPLPETVTVEWKTADGKSHRILVPVSGKRPFRELVVMIDGDGVSATVR